MYTKNERHAHMSVFFANKNSILDISLQKNVTSKLILVLEVRHKSFYLIIGNLAFSSSYILLPCIFEAICSTVVTSVRKKSSVDQSELEK